MSVIIKSIMPGYVHACYTACETGRHDRDNYKDCPNSCAVVLDCGGHCCLDARHEGGCECCGDMPGEPGTCPA